MTLDMLQEAWKHFLLSLYFIKRCWKMSNPQAWSDTGRPPSANSATMATAATLTPLFPCEATGASSQPTQAYIIAAGTTASWWPRAELHFGLTRSTLVYTTVLTDRWPQGAPPSQHLDKTRSRRDPGGIWLAWGEQALQTVCLVGRSRGRCW